MELVPCTYLEHSDLLRVDAGELVCDGGKPLPYPTYIGVVDWKRARVTVWTPAASKPRGYRSAAKRTLEDVLAKGRV
jgi:hypothetical protein